MCTNPYINLGLLHFLLGKNLVADQLTGQLQGLGCGAWKTSAPLLLSVRIVAGLAKFEILDFGMTFELCKRQVYKKETEALNFVIAPCELL